MTTHRPLSNIAHEIRRDWRDVNFAAKPYLAAMLELDQITDQYMFDTARSVVLYFLANAGSWRGPVAKVLKAELKEILKTGR
jgi:hypothetical protein